VYLILTASSDAYITDKIIDNLYRVDDANTGFSATLDLYKLYNESTIPSGTDDTHENTRGLIKFDYDEISTLLTDAKLDLDDPTLECRLELTDIMGGQSTPTNFNLILFPLAQAFDEGIGRDVVSYADVGATNWVTASFTAGLVSEWFMTGAKKEGLLGSNDIDVISSGNLNDGMGIQSLYSTQNFFNGSEDLSMDVTTVVSASVAGQMQNHGFLLAFSGTDETDDKTRFVKRFATRHVRNPLIRPRLIISWDDSIQDNHKNFFFDLTGSLFLRNYHYGEEANIVSGSALSNIQGSSCMKLDIVSGSFLKTLDVSQYYVGNTLIPGIYTASFAIPSVDDSLVNDSDTVNDFAIKSGSMIFEEYWRSNDETVGFYTGSLELKMPHRTPNLNSARKLDLIVTDVKNEYSLDDKAKFRVFVRDPAAERDREGSKLPIEIDSLVLNEVYYRIRDAITGKIFIPFKRNNNGTRLSSDTTGMFFEFYMNNLAPGRVYTVDFLVIDRGVELVLSDKGVQFRVNA